MSYPFTFLGDGAPGWTEIGRYIDYNAKMARRYIFALAGVVIIEVAIAVSLGYFYLIGELGAHQVNTIVFLASLPLATALVILGWLARNHRRATDQMWSASHPQVGSKVHTEETRMADDLVDRLTGA